MPATSRAQQRFMGMELGKKRAGEKTDVKMSEKQLKDFAGTKHKGLPEKARVGKGQSDMGPPRPTEPPSAQMEQSRSTYGPFDPPGYGAGAPQPMQSPPMPTYAPPSDGQVPGQGMDPIDMEIQRLLMQKQQQIQQGQQGLQQAMGGQPPMGQPQGRPQPPMGGAPGMGQGMGPDPRMAPPPIGTGLQTMPLGGKPLQDPSISSAMSPGIASRALGGPPPISAPPITGMAPKPPLPGGPPKISGAKKAPKKGASAAKKVRGKPRPAAGGRGLRKGKTGIGQAAAPADAQKVGTGQAGSPGMAPAANNPYVMVKGRPYEQMPSGILQPMVSPSTGQEAQAPQPPAQATAQPVGPPPQQGGVAPMGMPRPAAPPAPPTPPPPAGVGMGQGDPTIGGALAGASSTPPWMAQVSMGDVGPSNPARLAMPRASLQQAPAPPAAGMGGGYRHRGGWSRPTVGSGQGIPSPALAGVGSIPAAPSAMAGGVAPMGIPRQRPAAPAVPGGAPGVPAVGLGQSSKRSMPTKKRGGY